MQVGVGSGKWGVAAGARKWGANQPGSPGSMYKRFRMTTGQRMNRMAVESYTSQIAAAGIIIYSQTATQSEQTSVLAVKQMASRIAAESESKHKVDLKA